MATTPSLISPAEIPPIFTHRPPVRLGIMASGNGSNLEAIAHAIGAGELHARIVLLIYNNPQAFVKQRADRFHIPSVLLNHREFASRSALDQHIIKTLVDFQVEWVIMAGWMRLVTQELIDAFPQRILNIHPSLLPSFPGIGAVEQALKSGVKITGCTVHQVILAVDSGPILIQSAVPVLPGDSLESLHSRIQVEEHRILPRAISLAIQSDSLGNC
ncbi:MAG: phosphoribosylglycinamide formyltransferase [Cyanobacteria bacterium LVE1205-1]